MKIDRMELADIASPSGIAGAIVSQLGSSLTIPVPVETIAESVGIEKIEDFEMPGFEGALITDLDKNSGIILCKAGSIPERRRYTIGHELGHYLNPWHIPTDDGFRCSSAQMQLEDTKNSLGRPKWEAEANAFAAELLMPKGEFGSRLRKVKNLSVETILNFSVAFAVSKIACARRIISFEQEDCAVLVSKYGVLKFCYRSKSFPYISLRIGMHMPRCSISLLFGGGDDSFSSMEESESSFWSDRHSSNHIYFEQVLVQRDGWRMTFLVCEEIEDENRDND